MRLVSLALVLLVSSVATAGKPAVKTMSRKVRVGDVIMSPAFGEFRTRWVPIKKGVEEGRATPSFSKAMFVVTGASYGAGGHDTLGPIPEGWQVEARELTKDGRYNPRGRKITFFQSRLHTPDIPPEQIVLVKRLRLSFGER
jgi:hypothetical protein